MNCNEAAHTHTDAEGLATTAIRGELGASAGHNTAQAKLPLSSISGKLESWVPIKDGVRNAGLLMFLVQQALHGLD
jgi:hypothetical protein